MSNGNGAKEMIRQDTEAAKHINAAKDEETKRVLHNLHYAKPAKRVQRGVGAGIATGLVIGSIVPGVGTLIGGAIGGATGAVIQAVRTTKTKSSYYIEKKK